MNTTSPNSQVFGQMKTVTNGDLVLHPAERKHPSLIAIPGKTDALPLEVATKGSSPHTHCKTPFIHSVADVRVYCIPNECS